MSGQGSRTTFCQGIAVLVVFKKFKMVGERFEKKKYNYISVYC